MTDSSVGVRETVKMWEVGQVMFRCKVVPTRRSSSEFGGES